MGVGRKKGKGGWMIRWIDGQRTWNYKWNLKKHSRLPFLTQVNIFAMFTPKQHFKLNLFPLESKVSYSFKNKKKATCTKCNGTGVLTNETKSLDVTHVQGNTTQFTRHHESDGTLVCFIRFRMSCWVFPCPFNILISLDPSVV